MVISTRSSQQERESLTKIAQHFRALSEPTRLAILQELKSGAKTVNELMAAIGTTQPNISKQLRVLHEAGFVSRERRGIYAHYRLESDFVLGLCRLVCDRLNQQARKSLPNYSI